MLSSSRRACAAHQAGIDYIQPDAPRVGGITPFLQIMALAASKRLQAGPALRDGDPPAPGRRLPASSPGWSTSNGWARCSTSRLQLKDGRMHVPDRPGLGFSLSEQALRWTTETQEFGKRP
jgi:L-alanine-DL-glutamate epimerase-like enolase superfamily enzyme